MPKKEKKDSFIDKILKDKNLNLKVGADYEISWVLSTGQPSVDVITGRDKDGFWGIPGGSIVVISGGYAVGKSSLAINIMAEAQKPDPLGRRDPMTVYYQENEAVIDPVWIDSFGIDRAKMVVDDGIDSIEQAFYNQWQVLQAAKEEGKSLCICLDSLSALPTMAEMSAENLADFIGGQPGVHSKSTAKALRVITRLVKRTKSILIIIVQNKADLSSAMASRYKKKTHLAEMPLGFHGAILYDIARTEWVPPPGGGKTDEPVGITCRVKAKKTKYGAPMKVADDLVLRFSEGFDYRRSLHNALNRKGFIERNGIWFTFKGAGIEAKYPGKKGLDTLDDITVERMAEALVSYNPRATEETEEIEEIQESIQENPEEDSQAV